MTWFERLTGFAEVSPQQVRENLVLDGERLRSLANGRELVWGRLETPSLGELRDWVRSSQPQGGKGGKSGKLVVQEVVANVQDLHRDGANVGALFQVASQFNLLEMVSPQVTPEEGVGIYEHDLTQGPACAIAAGAGTIYRNYFVKVSAEVNGQVGQSAGNQIDCLGDLGAALGNGEGRLWQMRNGYALASRDGLVEIGERLRSASEAERDELRQLLRVGLQWETEVTLEGCGHRVSQVYCSALPVGYSDQGAELWREFAELVLEAAYEATVCAAIVNAAQAGAQSGTQPGNKRLFLTLLGGGVFGNEMSWILGAIERALGLYRDVDLEVTIVSYGRSNAAVRALVDRF